MVAEEKEYLTNLPEDWKVHSDEMPPSGLARLVECWRN
jgi:hypothetical protein